MRRNALEVVSSAGPLPVLFGMATTFPTLLLSTLLLSLANVLATAGGIGGGGFYVPILTALQGLEAHEAIPLSKALIFVANLVILGANFHIVDFEAAAMMQPASLAGTVVGELLILRRQSSLQDDESLFPSFRRLYESILAFLAPFWTSYPRPLLLDVEDNSTGHHDVENRVGTKVFTFSAPVNRQPYHEASTGGPYFD